MIRLLLLVALLSGCAAPPIRADDPPQPADAEVFVLLHDWHTEVSVPAARLTGGLTRLHAIFPDAAYFSFGFGERLYFQKSHTDFVDMVRAVMPGPGTVLITALAAAPDREYHDVEMVKLELTQAQLDRLADYLWNSLEKTPDGRLNKLGDGKFPGYVFYGAAPTYSGLFTCNTWVMEALDQAGLDAGAPGTLFASQVMERARALAAQEGH